MEKKNDEYHRRYIRGEGRYSCGSCLREFEGPLDPEAGEKVECDCGSTNTSKSIKYHD